MQDTTEQRLDHAPGTETKQMAKILIELLVIITAVVILIYLDSQDDDD
jgi:hypothetical protein